jgi:hypothetical protein
MVDVWVVFSLLKASKFLTQSILFFILASRDSVVAIATVYGLDGQGIRVRVPVGSRIFSTSSRPAMGSTQPPIQWVLGDPSPRVKRPGREADCSPPTSAEVKKMWVYTSTPPVKHRNNFTFYLCVSTFWWRFLDVRVSQICTDLLFAKYC